MENGENPFGGLTEIKWSIQQSQQECKLNESSKRNVFTIRVGAFLFAFLTFGLEDFIPTSFLFVKKFHLFFHSLNALIIHSFAVLFKSHLIYSQNFYHSFFFLYILFHSFFFIPSRFFVISFRFHLLNSQLFFFSHSFFLSLFLFFRFFLYVSIFSIPHLFCFFFLNFFSFLSSSFLDSIPSLIRFLLTLVISACV